MDSRARESYEFCKKILPQVSRTFAINIAVLTGNLRKAILVAYLFCRIADTVEDSEDLPLDTRTRMLDDYIDAFSRQDFSEEQFRLWSAPFESRDSEHPYNRLIQNSHLVLRTYLTLPEKSRQAISDCVIEMSQGMRKTVARRQDDRAGIKTLESVAELEQYCYYVAGTVGIMLTTLFSDHAPAMSESAVKLAKQLEVSFGLGLQITNIIKDCREDYQRGWCYIPGELTERHGVPLEGFLEPKHREQSQAVMQEMIAKAASHLDDAMNYTLLLPRREVRMRLFCLWPLFFAIKTLLVANHNSDVLSGERPVKITRRQVYLTICHTTLACYSNRLLRSSYLRLRDKLRV
jgi:farnesyl-diphosphate farnesyltransferase